MVWGLAALASVLALVVAVAGRDRGGGGGPTLRPMAASESMSDEQAYAVAADTVRVWDRERNARHLANVQALSCPETRDGALAYEIRALKGEEFLEPLHIDALARFTRNGPVWTLDTFNREGGGSMFVLQVRSHELLVCQIESAPVP